MIKGYVHTVVGNPMAFVQSLTGSILVCNLTTGPNIINASTVQTGAVSLRSIQVSFFHANLITYWKTAIPPRGGIQENHPEKVPTTELSVCSML